MGTTPHIVMTGGSGHLWLWCHRGDMAKCNGGKLSTPNRWGGWESYQQTGCQVNWTCKYILHVHNLLQ